MSSLFEDKILPFIGVTGPITSGKSLFLLSIVLKDPEDVYSPATGWSKPPRTIVYDDEHGTDPYSHVRNFKRVDMAEMVADDAPLWKIWDEFVSSIKAIKPGEFDCCAIDTNELLENALLAWVRQHPVGGHTQGQYDKMAGLMFADMKTTLMSFLTRIAAPRFQVFAWSAHERTEWQNNQPTTRKRPYGKTTWMQCASLYLRLERLKKAGQSAPPQLPRGTKLKARTMYIRPDGSEGDWLPEVIQDCTPERIREYARNPADFKKLKKSEQLQDTVQDGSIQEAVTDDDRLRIQAKIEEDKRVQSESALALLERRMEFKERNDAAPGKAVILPPQERQKSLGAKEREAIEASDRARMVVLPPIEELATENLEENGHANVDQISQIKDLWTKASGLPETALESTVRKQYSCTLVELTAEQAETIINKLHVRLGNSEG